MRLDPLQQRQRILFWYPYYHISSGKAECLPE